MHEPQLALAAWPNTTTVLRLKLMPYSIGHELLLWRHGSPFVIFNRDGIAAMDAVDRIEAVKRAAMVCSRSWQDNQRDVANLGEWLKKSGEDNHDEAAVAFMDYRDAGSLEFKADLPSDFEGKTVFVGCPQLLQLYTFVQKHVSRHEIVPYGTTAWDFPLGLAKMMWQAQAEQAGGLQIYNFRQKSHDDFVAEQEALRIAEEAKQPEQTA